MALKPLYDLVGDISILHPQKEMPKHAIGKRFLETTIKTTTSLKRVPIPNFAYCQAPHPAIFPLLKVLSCKQYNVKEERASYKIPIFVHSSTQ